MDLIKLYDKISDDNQIVVTHIINPNKFYIKFTTNKSEVELMEMELDRLYKHETRNQLKPRKGDMVALHHPVWNKHIRVIVDEVEVFNNKLSFILWAVDYGLPVFIQTTCYFKDLPSKYRSRSCNIYEASLQILPAKYECDFAMRTTSLVRCAKWIDTAVSTFKKYTQNAAELKFKTNGIKNEKVIGDILLKDNIGKVFSMSQILVGKYALNAGNINDFNEKVSFTDTVHIRRWDDNEKRAEILNHPLDQYNGRNFQENKQFREKKAVYVPSVENWNMNPTSEELYSSTGTDIEKLVEKIQSISDRDYGINKCDTHNRASEVKMYSDSPRNVPSAGTDIEKLAEKIQSISDRDYGVSKCDVYSSGSEVKMYSDSPRYVPVIDNILPKTKKQSATTGNMKPKQKNPLKTSVAESSSQPMTNISDLKDRLEQRKRNPANKKFEEPKAAPKLTLIPAGANYIQMINPIKRSIASDELDVNDNNNRNGGHFTQSNQKDIRPSCSPQLLYNNNIENKPSFYDNVDTTISSDNKSFHDYSMDTKILDISVPEAKRIPRFEKAAKPDKKPVPKTTKTAMDDEARIINAKTMRKVLIKGMCAGPVETRVEANFSQSVENYMKRYMFKKPLRIQQYAWPNILECNSFVAVGRSRKTFSYLPGICSIIDQKELSVNGKNQLTLGPIAIIIVKSASDVVYIGKICQQIFPHNNIDIVTGYGSKNIAEVLGRLLNGCHFFISTPRFFTRLLNESCKFIDRKRIEHLVIDDYDQMLENFKSDIDSIFMACCRTNNCEDNPQIVITSSVWYPHMEDLIGKYTVNPFLLFADYLEAAVFLKSEFKLQIFEDSDEKFHAVRDYLKDHRYTSEKTIVITNTDEEVRELCSHLNSTVIFINLLEEPRIVNKKRVQQWNRSNEVGEFPLLIISNEMLKQVEVSMAQHIIHYSLPSTFDIFSDRYECSLGFFHQCLENPKLKGSSLILLDDENNIELPRLIEFWTCHGNIELPPSVDRLIENAMIEREKSITGLVCPRIFDFGHCLFRKKCNDFRHAFNRNDKPIETLPDGMIKFNVIEVHSLKKFTIKITEISINENWIKYQYHNNDFQLKMNIDLNYEENLVNVSKICPGMICAAKSSSENFDRVVIVAVEKNRISTNLTKARVFYIDKGKVEDILSSELFVLPEEFKRHPPTVCELYINGLIPADYDENWDPHALQKMKEIIKEHSNNKKYEFVCNVDFVISNIIFTETISIWENFSTLKLENICKIDVKRFLLKNNYCVEDRNSLEKLKTLAKAAGVLKMAVTNLESVEVPSDNITRKIPDKSKAIATGKPKTMEIAKPKLQPTHKWIDIKLNKSHEVYITNLNDPENIFVQVYESSDNWDKMKKAMREVNKTNLPESEIEVGKNCMIDNDGSWTRVMITGKYRGKVKCFYVDSGYSECYFSDELYEIPDNVLNIIDFQAIHCRLVGLKDWQEKFNSDFKNLLESYEFIFMKPVKKYDYYSKWERYNYYGVVLFGANDEDDAVNLNQMIIENKWAEVDPEMVNYLSEDLDSFDECESNEDWDNVAINNSVDSSNNDRDQSEPNGFNITNMENFEFNFDDSFAKKFGYTPEMFGLQSFDQLTEKEDPRKSETKTKLNKTTKKDTGVNKESVNNQLSQLPDIPLLHSIYKPSKILWMQNDIMIKLVVEAVDCLDYTFEADTGYILLIVKFADHHEVTFLNFFGKIEPSLTSHEIVGLQIIIKFVKLLQTNEMWPRLMKGKSRNNFIKYHMSYINVEDEVNLTSKTVRFDDVRETTDFHDDSDESDDAIDDDACDDLDLFE